MTTFARPEQRAAERAEIERQQAEWLNKGNQITRVPIGAISAISATNGDFKNTIKTHHGGVP